MRKAGGPFVLRSAASAPPRALSDRRSSAIHAKIVVWFSAVAEQIGLGVQHSTDMLWPLVLSSRLLSATPRERRGAEPRGDERRGDATRCSSCCREAGGRRRHRTEPNRTEPYAPLRAPACDATRRDSRSLSFSRTSFTPTGPSRLDSTAAVARLYHRLGFGRAYESSRAYSPLLYSVSGCTVQSTRLIPSAQSVHVHTCADEESVSLVYCTAFARTRTRTRTCTAHVQRVRVASIATSA